MILSPWTLALISFAGSLRLCSRLSGPPSQFTTVLERSPLSAPPDDWASRMEPLVTQLTGGDVEVEVAVQSPWSPTSTDGSVLHPNVRATITSGTRSVLFISSIHCLGEG